MYSVAEYIYKKPFLNMFAMKHLHAQTQQRQIPFPKMSVVIPFLLFPTIIYFLLDPFR